ncbi:MAG: hypothetical protein LAO30_07850, partial [Acidobacteriia bacterium]|nr:hypothetical protein [Terriglobia bacterium]
MLTRRQGAIQLHKSSIPQQLRAKGSTHGRKLRRRAKHQRLIASLASDCRIAGLTVFVISWVNPDAKLAEKSFEQYMREGVIKAIDLVEEVTGERKINTIGYCVGGT